MAKKKLTPEQHSIDPAAQEMLRRADHLVDRRASGRVWGGTFHGISHRLLRRFGPAVGLAEGFTILDQNRLVVA